MKDRFEITGSIQLTKKSKYYQAVLNIPIGIGNKTKPKWVSTGEKEKMKAYKKFVAFAGKYEEMLNDPTKSLEEKLEIIFPPKAPKAAENTADCTLKTEHQTKDIFQCPANQIKLVDLLRHWRYAFEGIEETTLQGYEDNFGTHIIPYFEKKDLYVVNTRRRDIQEFANYLGREGRVDGAGGLSKESVKKYVSNVRKVFDFAVDEEWIEETPVHNIKYPVNIFPKVEVEPLHIELEQMIMLLNYVLDEEKLNDVTLVWEWGYAAGIIFAAFYALRRSEIFGLRWTDIDWQKDIVRIDNAIVRVKTEVEKRPKSKASRAPMPLLPVVKSFLIRLKQYQEKCAEFYGDCFTDSNYICCRKADGSRFGLDYINHRLKKDLKKLGIEPIITQHELRHSTATLLRSLGFAEQEIQSWLRHADLETTMHYAHDTVHVKVHAGNMLNNVLKLECICCQETTPKETGKQKAS